MPEDFTVRELLKEGGMTLVFENSKAEGIQVEISSFDESVLSVEKGIKIFDPAYGDGALLKAAVEISKEKKLNVDIFGCDINPPLEELYGKKLLKCDFFESNLQQKFDVVLICNAINFTYYLIYNIFYGFFVTHCCCITSSFIFRHN